MSNRDFFFQLNEPKLEVVSVKDYMNVNECKTRSISWCIFAAIEKADRNRKSDRN